MSLFKVGEEVILQSVEYPHLSGDAVVLDVYRDCLSGSGIYEPGYRLSIDHPKASWGWTQSALRKKYKPGEDFNTLMDKLKTGDVVDA